MTKTNIFQELFNINVININQTQNYTWKSGIKAPIYIDNRLIISYPSVRKKIITELKQLIIKNYNLDQINIIFGTATAGIAPAILLSSELDLPCGYVRTTQKQYGKNKIIEGFYQDHWKAIIIEDTISTGASVFNAIEMLKKAKIEVIGIITIFSYELKQTQEKLAKKKIQLNSLITFNDLLVEKNKFINSTIKKKLIAFYDELNNYSLNSKILSN